LLTELLLLLSPVLLSLLYCRGSNGLQTCTICPALQSGNNTDTSQQQTTPLAGKVLSFSHAVWKVLIKTNKMSLQNDKQNVSYKAC
jgi:hypothetical protein